MEVGSHVSHRIFHLIGGGHTLGCRPAGAGVGVRESVSAVEVCEDSTNDNAATRSAQIRLANFRVRHLFLFLLIINYQLLTP